MCLLALALLAAATVAATTATTCTCNRPTTTYDREIFIYRVNVNNPVTSYPLGGPSNVTTITLFTPLDKELDTVCTAHEHQVRVVAGTGFSASQLSNTTARQAFIQRLSTDVTTYCLDGVNMDFEDPIATPEQRTQLTSLMKDLRVALDAIAPNLQLSFAVAWSPQCIDGRCYDYAALGEICDLLFMMHYDMQSQIFPARPCQAYANSPLSWNTQAINAFLQLGIPASKLLFGVPWYGYHYPCLPGSTPQACAIKPVPFRGVSCSDAAGSQWNYAQIMEFLATNITATVEWDNVDQAPWFSYSDSGGGELAVVRYDDPQSLQLKYQTAKAFGLRGVGMWNADTLDYTSSSPRVQQQTKAMWDAITKQY